MCHGAYRGGPDPTQERPQALMDGPALS
jgi:hypothetical protein